MNNNNKGKNGQNGKNTSQKLVLKKKKNDSTQKYQQKIDKTKMNYNFYRALTKPFDPTSIGCTVPDPFPFPTVAYHLHQTTVISQPSGVTRGSVLFLPNPILSMIDTWSLNQTIPGSSTGIQATPFNQYGTSDGRRCLYGATSPSGMYSIFSTYRVVSWGVKISNLQPELSATGRIIVALVPLGDTVPSYNTLAQSTVIGSSVLTVTGLPVNQLDSSAILELPSAIELTVGDMLKGDLEISGMYTNTNFWSFKTTSTQGAVTAGSSGDEVSVVSGSVNTVGYKDDTRCVGGCGIQIYWEGVPAGSNGFQFETIYHLEGSPVLTSGTNNIPVPSCNLKTNVGSLNQVEASMSKASELSSVYEFVNTGMNFLNNNSAIIKSGASLLGKFLM